MSDCLKMIRTYLVIAALMAVTEVDAQRYWQRVDIALNFGYATFKMTDLKQMQEEQLSYMPVDAKITNSFPGYLNYSIDAVFYDSTYFVGVLLGHTSTGGRVNTTDYSGSITYDQLVTMNYNGLVAAKKIANTKIGNLFIGTNLMTYFNKAKFEYSEIILGESTTSSYTLESFNVALGPFLQLHKRIRKIFLKASAGYEFHIPMELTTGDPNSVYISPASGETFKVQADGLRLSIGVGYALYTRRPKE
ncbi:MAG TPA: hypothetical protein VK589_08905 [Chryseolinea sp.]|nr:hypothetical protein [Chryseolinea sp.]